MFEMDMPTREDLAALDDRELIEWVRAGTCAEAAVAAARLAVIAELVDRHCGEPTSDGEDESTVSPRALWACDDWDHLAAEISAAMGITARRASGQMHIGRNLRHRLPRVGALLAAGAISYRIASTISWRTSLVICADALNAIDSDFSAAATGYSDLSDARLELAIDATVMRHDPDAGWRAHLAATGRTVRFRHTDDDCGTVIVFARLLAADALLLQRRLDAMIATVCDDDPRTVEERRADALGALSAGDVQLACTCPNPDCPARTSGADARAEAIHIHVLADPATIAANTPAPAADSTAESATTAETAAPTAEPTEPAEPATAEPAPSAEPATTAPAPPKPCVAPPSPVLLGHGPIPASLLAELLRLGASPTPLRTPGDEPEPGYRPSAALAAFIRMRDLTCRFPGCSVPADKCDIDHVTPWPAGPTHPSNLACACRKNHLLKTFSAGPGGWTVRQLPDATQIWTAPTGATYITVPGSRLVFPNWNTTTAELPDPPPPEATPGYCRNLQMPTRRRTRAQDRAQRIKAQRQRNHDQRLAEQTASEHPP